MPRYHYKVKLGIFYIEAHTEKTNKRRDSPLKQRSTNEESIYWDLHASIITFKGDWDAIRLLQ